MIRRFLFSTVAVVAGSSLVAFAAPKDEVTDAAKKLADAPNYSWKANTQNNGGGGGGGGRGFGAGPSEGKAEKDGFAVVTMTRGDNTIEIVRKGDKVAFKTPDGWQSLEDLRQQGGQGGGQGQGRGRFMGGFLRGVRMPADEAANLASKAKDLKKDGDAYAADLTEEGAKEMLFPRPRGGNNAGGQGNFTPPEPTNAKGTVKFWVKDGQLSKYEYNVKGQMSFGGNDIDIDRTTTIEIKDVGSTKVEVPAEAKGKLSETK